MNAKHHEYLSIGTFLLVVVVIVIVAASMSGYSLAQPKAKPKAGAGTPAVGSVGTNGSGPAMAPST